jgi:hypothetical protein
MFSVHRGGASSRLPLFQGAGALGVACHQSARKTKRLNDTRKMTIVMFCAP